MRTRKVKGTFINNMFRRIKNIMGDDIKESYQVTPYGFDSNPVDNATSVESTTTKYLVTAGYIQKAIDDLQKGEVCVFSKNSKGELQATIKLRGDKTVEFLGNDDNLVRYKKLQEEFDELKGKLNGMVDEWNLFATTYVPGSPTVTGLPPTVNTTERSNADISNAKHEGLKTN